MNRQKTNTYVKAFTLVELIVVVTILAILATIGFVSYSSYLTGVRDTNRLAQLVSIHDGLELYKTKKDLPLPDDNVEVKTNGALIAYQGYVGKNTLETIDFTKGGKDPKDNQYFSYSLSKDRKYFQLLAFLEEEENLQANISIATSSHAADYENRVATVYGKKLGILTDDEHTPIQEISTIATAGELNLTNATTGYTAYLTDTETYTGSLLLSINPKASCKRIKQMSGGASDGVYTINPTGASEMKVYCDMTTDGGGWTFFGHMNSDSTGNNFFENGVGTYKSTREDDGTKYSLGSDIFADTEMMVTLDQADPRIADEENKIVFYKYSQNHTGFNSGPIPCTGLGIDFSYKTHIGGNNFSKGTSICNANEWYPRNTSNSEYLVLFSSSTNGNYLGAGVSTGNSWSHDGWWYLR